MIGVLRVLNEGSKPMKLTQIILKVKGLKPIRKKLKTHDGRVVEVPPFIQLELASALAGRSVSWWMADGLERPHREASKLYASFARTVRTLVRNGLVDKNVEMVRSRRAFHAPRQRQHSYRITQKGREILDGCTD
jgi:hypothetical protein